MALKQQSTRLLRAGHLQELFPPVEFAFYGNHINRYKERLANKVRTHSQPISSPLRV